MVGILSHYIGNPNHHDVYFKYHNFINYTSIKLRNNYKDEGGGERIEGEGEGGGEDEEEERGRKGEEEEKQKEEEEGEEGKEKANTYRLLTMSQILC